MSKKRYLIPNDPRLGPYLVYLYILNRRTAYFYDGHKFHKSCSKPKELLLNYKRWNRNWREAPEEEIVLRFSI